MRAATWLRHPALPRVVAMALGAVFLYASIDKIANPRDFARIVYHYQVVGPNLTLGYLPANAFAATLPWVEAVCGVFLILGLWRRESAGVCVLLLLLFVVAAGSAMARGIDIENCGCFRVEGGRSAGWGLLLGDVGLLGVALFLSLGPSGSNGAVKLLGDPRESPLGGREREQGLGARDHRETRFADRDTGNAR